jgi:hypothetical protein
MLSGEVSALRQAWFELLFGGRNNNPPNMGFHDALECCLFGATKRWLDSFLPMKPKRLCF